MPRIQMPTLVTILMAFAACTQRDSEPRTQAPVTAPPEVRSQLAGLMENQDDDHPGATVVALRQFLSDNPGYTIADTVEQAIGELEESSVQRFRDARDLAREGQFQRAQEMLEDLALMPNTPGGQSAGAHLEFDFYYGRAQWLLYRQRFSECRQVALALRKRDLSPVRANQVEALLDQLGHVDAAMGQTEKAQAMAACRQLSIYLSQLFVEQGSYPARFSLDDTHDWDPGISRSLSAIEDYRPARNSFSFVGVSSSGAYRVSVVDGVVQNQ